MSSADEYERPGIPGTEAHRAALRQLIDAKDRIPESVTASLGLSEEQEAEIQQIIQAEYDKPLLSAANSFEMLEGLMTGPVLTVEEVYVVIDDYRSILLHRIAAMCYAAGMKAAGTAGAGQTTE